MTEQTARERIEAVLGEAYAVGYLDGRDGHMDRFDYVKGVDSIIAIVRGALIPSLSKYAYEQSTPVALSEFDGSPTWEEVCARQHSITAYISSDIYKLINAAFGKDVRDAD